MYHDEYFHKIHLLRENIHSQFRKFHLLVNLLYFQLDKDYEKYYFTKL